MKNSFYYPAMRAMNLLAIDTGFLVANFRLKMKQHPETFKYFFKLLLIYANQSELLMKKVEADKNDK